MSNIDKRALREAAEKATPGPWRMALTKFNGITHGKFSFTKEDIIASSPEKRNAIFIAAANPATVLALLDELEAKDLMVADLLNIISRHTIELGWGEKPITLAELIISREGSGSDALAAIRAASSPKGE